MEIQRGKSRQEKIKDVPSTDTKEVSNAETCMICTEPIEIFAVGICNHKVCHLCSLRLRILYKQTCCTYCKTDNQKLFLTIDASTPFDKINETQFKIHLNIYIDQRIYEKIVNLLKINCPQCPFSATSISDLKSHVKNVHKLMLCDVCVKFKKLWLHCKEKHEQCHICQSDGVQHVYYQDYSKLEEHFKEKHHFCLDQECLEKKFVVFKTDIDLKAHQGEVHNMKYTKKGIKIQANFDFGSRPSTSSTDRAPRDHLINMNDLYSIPGQTSDSIPSNSNYSSASHTDTRSLYPPLSNTAPSQTINVNAYSSRSYSNNNRFSSRNQYPDLNQNETKNSNPQPSVSASSQLANMSINETPSYSNTASYPSASSRQLQVPEGFGKRLTNSTLPSNQKHHLTSDIQLNQMIEKLIPSDLEFESIQNLFEMFTSTHIDSISFIKNFMSIIQPESIPKADQVKSFGKFWTRFSDLQPLSMRSTMLQSWNDYKLEISNNKPFNLPRKPYALNPTETSKKPSQKEKVFKVLVIGRPSTSTKPPPVKYATDKSFSQVDFDKIADEALNANQDDEFPSLPVSERPFVPKQKKKGKTVLMKWG